MHKHHIIPIHMGGTDDADNLIECTVEEHANFHKELYEKYGNEFDLIAYRGLTGQISMTEAKRLAQKEGGRKGARIVNAIREAKGNTIGAWNKETGNVLTIATPESRIKAGETTGKIFKESGRWEEVRLLGSKASGKKMMPLLNAQKWKCLECGMISSTGGISNHQKAKRHNGKEKVCQQQY